MSPRRLVWRGIQHYWRIYLCMGLGIALTASLISGSLILGTSVHSGLRSQALAQLGPIQWSLLKTPGFFRNELAQDMGREANVDAHALLFLSAVAQHPEAAFPPEKVQLIGASKDFPGFAQDIARGDAVLNKQAQSILGLKAGDVLIIRLAQNPGSAGDRPMAHTGNEPKAIRLRVASLHQPPTVLDFSMHRGVPQAANVWVDRDWLANELGEEGRANLIVVASEAKAGALKSALRKHWRLEDLGLGFKDLGEDVQLESEQVLLSNHIVEAQGAIEAPHSEILGWFAFEFRSGEKKSPYGFFAARSGPDDRILADDEIIVNRWLADDLELGLGATLELSFPDFSQGELRAVGEKSFKVVGILPMEGAGADAALMPAFPGFSGVKNCRDWQPGVAFESSKIRPKDELYWDQYGGAPKAYVSMTSAESIGENPYGVRTAIRLSKGHRVQAEEGLLKILEPQRVGFSIQNLRAHHLAASVPANDLGQLFLGFGFLLMASALLLSAMLFAFAVLRRRGEIYTLYALGWRPKAVRRLLVQESMIVAAVFASLGAAGGLVVAKVLLDGLGSFWRGAVGATPLGYEARVSHVLIAFGASLVLAWIVVRVASRKMESNKGAKPRRGSSRKGLALACLSAIGCVIAWIFLGGLKAPIGAFVIALLLLVVGLSLTHAWLGGQQAAKDAPFTFLGLARRYVRRRPGRSLAVVILTSLGCFLVLAVGANQKDPLAQAAERSSGTGGFALYGESTLPIRDREALGDALVPFRRRAGDDASCLNVGNAQNPTILGVNPEELSVRGAFGVKEALGHESSSVWALLDGDGAIPVIGDEATLRWGLKLAPGDEFEIVGEGEAKHRLKVVAMLSTNVLQGNLVMSEEHFKRLFPEQSGYQLFLVDSVDEEVEKLQASLAERYGDFGLRLKPTTERLAQFHAVENTYLDIFQALGTLGMMLGILGLAIMLLFNVIDRRSDLSILWAMGFRKRRIAMLLAMEHLSLMILGLVLGCAAAFVAIWPSLASPGDPVSMTSITYALVAIMVVGLLSIASALGWALRSTDFSSPSPL